MEQKTREKKTALLVYCTRQEAAQIKAAAKRERRTISGYVINAVMTRLAVAHRIEKRNEQTPSDGPGQSGKQ